MLSHASTISSWLDRYAASDESSQALSVKLQGYLRRVSQMLNDVKARTLGSDECVVTIEFPRRPRRMPSPFCVDWGDSIIITSLPGPKHTGHIGSVEIPSFVTLLEPLTIVIVVKDSQSGVSFYPLVHEVFELCHGPGKLNRTLPFERIRAETLNPQDPPDQNFAQIIDRSMQIDALYQRDDNSPQSNVDVYMGNYEHIYDLSWTEGVVAATLKDDTAGGRRRLIQQHESSSATVFNSPASFFTADSPASFLTARTVYNSPAYVLSTGLSPMSMFETIEEESIQNAGPLTKLATDYKKGLRNRHLISSIREELDWSGKGQHIIFLPSETPPLVYISDLGVSLTAIVQKVVCRRIALARKTMTCSRRLSVEDALLEVTHLQNLHHRHIVQLVGTYLQGREFNLLMYPVANCHLGTFLQQTSDLPCCFRWKFLASSFGCLSSTISFVHRRTTKHMDIKPRNILVRYIGPPRYPWGPWRLYLADFGLSRSFADQGHSQTGEPTLCTRRYCAPEVYAYEMHGRAADIFSLGAVYLEIATVLSGRNLDDFNEWRRGDGQDESYHANLDRVDTWIQKLVQEKESLPVLQPSEYWVSLKGILPTVTKMLNGDPAERPTADHLVDIFNSSPSPFNLQIEYCCSLGPEPYVREDAILFM